MSEHDQSVLRVLAYTVIYSCVIVVIWVKYSGFAKTKLGTNLFCTFKRQVTPAVAIPA